MIMVGLVGLWCGSRGVGRTDVFRSGGGTEGMLALNSRMGSDEGGTASLSADKNGLQKSC